MKKIEPTEETHNLLRKYASLKAQLLNIQPQVIEFLKARKATKDDPHSEYLDGETWEDYWLEDGSVKTRLYCEDEEGNKTYWDED